MRDDEEHPDPDGNAETIWFDGFEAGQGGRPAVQPENATARELYLDGYAAGELRRANGEAEPQPVADDIPY